MKILEPFLSNPYIADERRSLIANEIDFLKTARVTATLTFTAALIHDLGYFNLYEMEDQENPNRRNCHIELVEDLRSDEDDGLSVSENCFASTMLDWVFIAEDTEDNVCWRAIQIEIQPKKETNRNMLNAVQLGRKMSDQCPRGIDRDSLSHFQNCRLPPGSTGGTPSLFQSQLAIGCLASVVSTMFTKSEPGGIKWKESRKRWKKASKPYGRLQKVCLGNSSSVSIFCQTSSGIIQISQRGYCQLFSGSKAVSLRATMQKRSGSSFFCLFSSGLGEKRNRDYSGEMN
jgi:hypothetical protein